MAPPARPALVVAAFAAVYLIWGSTYYAIRLVIDTAPPLLMAGARFLVAGAAMWFLAPGPRGLRPTRRDWGWAFILGGLLFLIGNGAVSIVETKMPTGVTALLITTVPLWLVILEWASPGGRRPTLGVALGLVTGFLGVGVLAGSAAGWIGGEVDYRFVALMLFGSGCWALGSLLGRGGRIKLPLLRSVALQMFAGGVLLTVAGFSIGEWDDLDVASISAASIVAWIYLIVFGSIVAFTAYAWLLSVRPVAMVGTYAFVNPVVAVLLGAFLLDEPLGLRTLLASVLIVGAVAFVLYAKSRPQAAAASPLPAAPGK